MRKTSNMPTTTLFLIQSLDGKISTGDTDEMDVDKDFPRIKGVNEGLHQYYDLEKRTDIVSLISGKVQAKIDVNIKDLAEVQKTNVSFVIVDNKPHLNAHGTEYFARRSRVLYIITTNDDHPAFKLKKKFDNIEIFYYRNNIDFIEVFRNLKNNFGIKRITIQTGGTLNATFLRLNLIDRVSIVIAPCLIGGKNTPSLVMGESLQIENELKNIKALRLVTCKNLKNNYVHLIYKVISNTVID